MNISGAAFKLTNEDLLSIINDTVKISGLKVDKIYINKYFYIFGSYKKFINIPFKIAIFLVEIGQNKLVFELKEVKVLIWPIFKWIRNTILKKALKDIKNIGIEYFRGSVSINLDKLLGNLPVGLKFKFKEIELRENLLLIETKDIDINLQQKKTDAQPITNDVKKELAEIDKSKFEKTKSEASSDKYSLGRLKLKNKMPEKYKVFFPYMMLLPDVFALFMRIYQDDRVSWKIKVKCGTIIAYLSSPIDMMFDFVPIFGQMDDLAMAFLALNTIMCDVPEEIIKEHWEGDEDIIVIVRRVLIYLHRFVGETNLSRLLRRVKNIFERDAEEEIFQGEKQHG